MQENGLNKFQTSDSDCKFRLSCIKSANDNFQPKQYLFLHKLYEYLKGIVVNWTCDSLDEGVLKQMS